MEHLALEIFDIGTGTGSKYAMLAEDASITITDTSEIFASGDVWSYSFTLNIPANAHIFGTSGDLHGSRLHDQIDKRRARLWVEGLPLFLGYLRLDDEVEVDANDNVEVRFESGQKTFEEKIEGAKANQVPMMDDVMIGVALWRKRYSRFRLKLKASATLDTGINSLPRTITHVPNPTTTPGDDDEEKIYFTADGEDVPVQEYPRMVFPKGRFVNVTEGGKNDFPVNCLNTDFPYTEDENGNPTHPFCNVALCYQKYGYDRIDERGEQYQDYSNEPEAQRGYDVMPADRVNSAPNFFVIYWIKALMKHLGIHIDENQMLTVEDLRRLFFVNTKCAYREPKYVRKSGYDEKMTRYRFMDSQRLVAEHFGHPKTERENGKDITVYDAIKSVVKISECGFDVQPGYQLAEWHGVPKSFHPYDDPVIKSLHVEAAEVVELRETEKGEYEDMNSWLHDAYATSECFPDADISDVVKALESGFGIRFLFSSDYKRVRIVLLRNVFRSNDVQDIECDIIAPDIKVENNIRGFRMTYGNNDDTHFYYKGFADMLPHKKEIWVDNSDTHDYSQWNLNAEYASLLDRVSAFNKTCYYTPLTGNAYGIKVDKDAKRYRDLHPSLFEFAGYMDAEDGDCTGEENTIETINVGYRPAIMNDLNWKEKKSGSQDNQRFALFVDEKMRPRRPDLQDGVDYNDSDAVYRVDEKLYGKDEDGNNTFGNMMAEDGIVKPGEFAITSDMPVTAKDLSAQFECWVPGTSGGDFVLGRVMGEITGINIEGHVNDGYRLYLQDNFEPNDDGVSPIEKHEWGITLGIMRGSGNDAHVAYSADPDDNEGNDTWDVVPGSSVTAHPDTCDNYGNEWDYDGSVIVKEGGTAIEQMQSLWPDSNINLIYKNSGRTSSTLVPRDADSYISSAVVQSTTDEKGNNTLLLFATVLGDGDKVLYTGKIKDYAKKFRGMTRSQMKAYDSSRNGFGILIETDSSTDRMRTLLELQKRAFFYGDTSVDPFVLDENGVGSRYGRFSLKLRAEKLNPNFGKAGEPRYLEITNENLRGRGLCDQFYKEYSYWVRNARIVKRTVRMELAQLLTIDKTVRVTVGDITGFIRKMQYSVSNKTGLGLVTMEIMYI